MGSTPSIGTISFSTVNRGYAIFITLGLLSAAFVLSTWAMVYRLAPEDRREHDLRWLGLWSVKGLFLPLALWTVLNVGLSWSLQPFMPEVQAAQNNGDPWVPEFLRVVGEGMFIVSSFWAALTLAWVLRKAAAGLQGQARADFKGLCVTCVLGLSLPALGIALLGGWPVLGMAAATILGPIASYSPNILRAKKTPPMYARAIARMKFGKYNEAEWEIIRELEKCEDDFDGWMMLAELYAKNFHDVAEAEQTVLELCDQPRTTPSQLSVALHRLSEWHLNLADNPGAARRALQMICDRLPGTHLAHMAQLRMNQLPATLEQLREMRNPRPIPVPEHFALPGSIRKPMPAGPPGTTPELEAQRKQAVEQANACVEKLTLEPNDVAAREELARLFAERLNQVDQGLEQITLLLNMPDQPDAKRAGWLDLMATWHINYRQDHNTGRKILDRLVHEFPESPEAAAAHRRAQTLDAEYPG